MSELKPNEFGTRENPLELNDLDQAQDLARENKRTVWARLLNSQRKGIHQVYPNGYYAYWKPENIAAAEPMRKETAQ